jgi:DNA-binding FadR family transcriptional regulator
MPDQVHRAIAAMSHNAVLQLFLDILEELSERYATRPAGINESSVEAIDRDIRRGHHEMVDAIIEGDTARAQRLTIEHLDSIADLLSSNVRNRRAWAAPVPVDVESEASGKLGVLLAEQIRRDLGSENRAVGDLIGSESALMQRYGVSRQILREAVRLLEHHGIAVMRRGASGGLTVAQPDPQASIDAVSVYLQYRNVDVADLRSVRNAIELACIDLVVARHDEPDVTTRLREALAVDQSATTDNVIASVHELHRELAEITGNPVLALFLNVLTSLWERRSVHCPPEAPPADTQMLSALQDAHTGIVEAVLDGDRGLARLRMLRHVEVLTAWWH